MDMPVIFFVDPLMDEETRLDDVRTVTLSYTFFSADDEQDAYESARASADAGEAS
jgi:cytochrome c oxidase assembly protein subunit 11